MEVDAAFFLTALVSEQRTPTLGLLVRNVARRRRMQQAVVIADHGPLAPARRASAWWYPQDRHRPAAGYVRVPPAPMVLIARAAELLATDEPPAARADGAHQVLVTPVAGQVRAPRRRTGVHH